MSSALACLPAWLNAWKNACMLKPSRHGSHQEVKDLSEVRSTTPPQANMHFLPCWY